MIIEEITLRGFGKFNELTRYNFGKGLNIIFGPNESGKTTLMLAILGMLFGLDDRKETKEKSRLNGWDDPEVYKGSITYVLADGRRFRIRRDFKENEVHMEQIDDQGEFTEIASMQQKVITLLDEQTGLGHKSIFENTVFVRAGELKSLIDSKALQAVRDRLENILTGTEKIPASKAIDLLDKKLKEIAGTKKDMGAGGKIREITEKGQELSEQMNKSREKKKNFQTRINEQQEIGKLIEKNSRELSLIRQIIDDREIKERKDKELERLNEEEKEISGQLEQIKTSEKEAELLEEKLKNMEGFSELPENTLEQMAVLQEAIKDKEESLEEKNNLIKEEQQRLAKPVFIRPSPLLAIGGVAGIFVAIALATIAILYGLKASVGLSILMSLVSFFVFFAGFVSLITYIIKTKQSQIKPDTSLLDQLKEETAKIQNELNERIDKLSNLLVKAKVESLDDFQERYLEFAELNKNLHATKKTLNALLKGKSIDDLKNKQQDIITEIAKVKIELENIPTNELSPEDILERQKRIKLLEKEIEQLKKQEGNLAGKIEMYQESTETSLDLDEESEYLKGKLQSLYRQRDSLRVAHEVMSEVTRDLQAIAVPDIVKNAENLFSRITNNRYTTLIMDEEMNISLKPKYTENPVTMTDLSTGTADQLYFSLRLATAELISQEKNPPIILDDSFVYFDEDRLENVRIILDEICKTHQIILFSHDQDFANWSNNVIRLVN